MRIKKDFPHQPQSHIHQAYLIFVIFWTPALISSSKFDTKKHVNRDKTDFATKQRGFNFLLAKAEWCGVEWCGGV